MERPEFGSRTRGETRHWVAQVGGRVKENGAEHGAVGQDRCPAPAVGLCQLLPISFHVPPWAASSRPSLTDASGGLDEACKSSPQALPCQNPLPNLPSPGPAPCPMPGSFPGAVDVGTREGLGPSRGAGDEPWPSAAAFLAARGHWGISGKKTKRIYHK